MTDLEKLIYIQTLFDIPVFIDIVATPVVTLVPPCGGELDKFTWKNNRRVCPRMLLTALLHVYDDRLFF